MAKNADLELWEVLPDDLPDAFLDGLQVQVISLSPEQRLLGAILREAISDAQGLRPDANFYTRKNHEDALAWIKSDATGWVFSFVNVCEALRLSPSAVRKALLNLSKIPRAPRWQKTNNRRLGSLR